MIPFVIIAFWVVSGVAPAQATQAEAFDPDQPFEQVLGTGMLRALLNQALDRLEEHVEISGDLSASNQKTDRLRYLRFKFYPEGKSKSHEHLSAEGWLRSTPESGQLDWHFRFKVPEERPQQTHPHLDAPL